MNVEFLNLVTSREEKLKEYLSKIKILTNINMFNEPSRRFAKSEIIENCLINNVYPEMQYVNALGHDLLYNGIKISVKTQNGAFQKRRENTKQIVLANLHGKNVKSKLRHVDYDVLMIISPDQSALAVADKDDVEPYTKRASSQFKCQIPFKKLSFLAEPVYNKKNTDAEEVENKIKKIHQHYINDIYEAI